MVAPGVLSWGQITWGRWGRFACGAVSGARVRHAEGHRLSRLLGEQGRDRPASDHSVDGAVHIPPKPLLAANGQVHHYGARETLRRIAGSDTVFQIQSVQLLRNALAERPHPVVPARRGFVGCLRYRVAAREANVMRSALVEPNLESVVPGIRGLQHQALEVARELRVLI